MASTSTKAAAMKSNLKPAMTLQGHGEYIRCISYFPDGQRMISGSYDKTARQWNLKAGREIEEARDVCKKKVLAVVVSRDGRWVITGGGDYNSAELKACEIETGIVKQLQGHSRMITCIDISVDNMLLASGARDFTVRIWNLDTGKLMTGPFKSIGYMAAVRFSLGSKKLAVKSWVGNWLEVWDVQSQVLDARIAGKFPDNGGFTNAPVFWTNKNKNILTGFSFTDDDARTIYEFDASTLQTVGAAFEGHTNTVTGLALSFDGTFLASAGEDDTIKLWAFESRQLLASFDVRNPRVLVLSPDSRKLAYTTVSHSEDDYKIYICNTPPDVLAQATPPSDLLNSNVTLRPAAGRCRPPIPTTHLVQRPLPAIDLQQPMFARLGKLLRFSFTNALRPGQKDQPRDPLDFSATLPLPIPLSGHTSTQGHSDVNSVENYRLLSTTRAPTILPTTFTALIHYLTSWWPVRGGHAQPSVVDIPLAQAQERNVAADAPKKDEDIVPIEYLDPPTPNPDSQQSAAVAHPVTGEHGGERSCFCF
ncbi:WD40-repeat-containing domain protein [Suillus subaureus]|uniref:WD40-repeat-containing domain protein n=1 Tax=Suillus subaureus TaxID=48587 RepID=A0A9P7EGV0_9AGAM|nr:WD40-repeat-containing domain protein [Suillus subaureus]KAG1821532.1 WD40-repeat-containing domain protein [Suillus subaureus]